MKYGCIGLFKHTHENPDWINKYEERVVVAEANSLEDAENKILAEFNEYASDGTEFLNIYEIFEVEEDGSVIEVASSMKVFDGSDEEYLEKYYDDQKPISCDSVGWKHVWYNIDNIRSGCMNCQENRKGQLWKNV